MPEALKTKAKDVFRKYQQQAIDFSRRNRLLKYPKKATKIDFNLTLDEYENYFGIISEISAEFPHKKILDAEKKIEDDKIDDKKREKIFDPKTTIIGKKLISALDKLRLQSKKNFDEHGLHTLFLVIGEVKWKEQTVGRGSTDATRVQDYNAPLLLIPIQLENSKDPYKSTSLHINTDQYPVRINPVLLSFIKQNLELRVPTLEGDLSEVGYEQVKSILAELTEIYKEKGIIIETTENAYIGQFSFSGQQIYEDLHKNEEQILSHSFVSGICSGDIFEGETSDRIKIDDEYNPDEFLNTKEDFSILDADSSQIIAIKKIISGEHMVIHGPPGTGKSQTIANLISNLLARGKTVLFVCEKQVALDVVYKRLSSDAEANISDLCLPLFKYTSNKKHFAADIISSRNSLIRETRLNKGANLEGPILDRQIKINFLREYAEEIIKKVEPLGKSLYWIFGELSSVDEKAKELSVIWKTKENPLKLELKDFLNRKQALKDLNPYLSLLEETNSKWNGLKRRHFSPDFSSRVVDVLNKIGTHLKIDPYKESEINYSSWDNIFNFYSKLIAEGDVLINQKGLNIDIIENRYLHDLKGKTDKVLSLVNQYNTLNTDNIFGFAENWKITHPPQLNFINNSTDIRKINTPDFIKSIDWLLASVESIDVDVSGGLSDISLKDFQAKSFLFSIDFSLAKIVEASKSNLYDLLNKIKLLETNYSLVSQSQTVLDKYNITLKDIAKDKIFSLEDKFIERYKTFLRIFSSDYRKDRDSVSSMCGFIKPRSYSETKNLVFAISARIKLEDKINDGWEGVERDFATSQGVRKLPLQYLNQKISSLIEYLELNHLEYLEPYLQSIVLNKEEVSILNTKSQLILKILNEWKKIQSDTKLVIEDQKVNSLESFLREAQTELAALRSLIKSTDAFVGYDKETTIDTVLDNCAILNNLKKTLDQIKELNPSAYIDFDLRTLVSDLEILKGIVRYLDTLLVIAEEIPETKFKYFESAVNAILSEKSRFNEWNIEFKDLIKNLSVLFENENLAGIYFSYKITEFPQLIISLIEDSLGLQEWIEYQKYSHLNNELGLGWFIKEVGDKLPSTNYDISDIYSWVFLNKWLEDYTKDKEILWDFDKNKYQKIIDEFRELERESLAVNRQRILRELLADLEYSKLPNSEAEKILKREAEKKMRHLPIRTLVKKYASHIQKIKPCWMVSPLALGSYLEYGSVDFDVVIFDEASQMKIENSLGAISRAKQVVVIGDEHQLPPTPFFGFSLDEDEEEDEDVAEETGFESILKRSISLLNGSETYLKYHRRSSSEDLIAFSNHHIYNGDLVTFPNAVKRDDQGVKFDFVKEGFYDGGSEGTKTNPKEAEYVAKLCIKLAEENNGSFGVIAFSKTQEKAIRKALEELLKSYPHLADKLDEASTESDPFFIKNLESVQGDERDRIILSICYGPDKLTGKVRNHFGPINQASGYRRLNVAITRAKEQLICVSSMHAYDMHPPESTRGAVLLQKYLEYAEKGVSVLEASKLVQDDKDVEADSDFELSVEAELKKLGYIVKRQVGASGFKIDLAIVNPKNKNEYILGIECDGAMYHSSKSARIRDRVRQDILEKLGWRIYRIWSQHWFMHKQDVIEDIIQIISKI